MFDFGKIGQGGVSTERREEVLFFPLPSPSFLSPVVKIKSRAWLAQLPELIPASVA